MDYDNGVLPADVRARFDDHLFNCPDCVNYLASYRAVKTLVKSASTIGTERLPPEVPRELIQAILSAYKHSSS